MTSADFDPDSARYSYPPAGSPQQRYVQPGGLAERFFARLIDGVVVNIVVFVLSLFFFRDSWFLVTGLFSGILMFGYFVVLEVTQGASLGKRLLGLSVLGPGGRPRPDFSQSAIRNSFTLLAVLTSVRCWRSPPTSSSP
ncbi:MAG TPA: RDD family protein [Mycobacteriales bacterium]|nr:RDD family protein [Mycobacteriales bacterium]